MYSVLVLLSFATISTQSVPFWLLGCWKVYQSITILQLQRGLGVVGSMNHVLAAPAKPVNEGRDVKRRQRTLKDAKGRELIESAPLNLLIITPSHSSSIISVFPDSPDVTILTSVLVTRLPPLRELIYQPQEYSYCIIVYYHSLYYHHHCRCGTLIVLLGHSLPSFLSAPSTVLTSCLLDTFLPYSPRQHPFIHHQLLDFLCQA